MKEKKVLIRVVPDAEIIGTSWHLRAMVFCSLNDLLKTFHLSRSKVKDFSLKSKTRYCLNIKIDCLPAFTIYDIYSFNYGVKCFNKEDVINWHIGTFNDELAKRVCQFLFVCGLNVSLDCSVSCVNLPF